MDNDQINLAIIDDDINVAFFLKHLLSHKYKTQFFSWRTLGGYAGIKKNLVSSQVDLIIIDVKLPGINGFQVGKDLRKSLDREIPIIYISASPEIEKFILLDQRNSYFLPKPFKSQEVKNVVDQMAKFIDGGEYEEKKYISCR